MGARVLQAAAPGKRLLRGSRAGRPLQGARGGADRGASQDSGDSRGRWLVRARLLQPPPPPLPPHVPPARPGPRSVPPATNGRRVLASQQPIADGAATPHTQLSWKEPRHPRPAALTPPPAPARATPPLTSPDRPPQVPPSQWPTFRKSERSPGMFCLLPYNGPPPRPGRAECAQGPLGLVVCFPEPSFPFRRPC